MLGFMGEESRRGVVKLAGVVLGSGLAGCLSQESGAKPTSVDTTHPRRGEASTPLSRTNQRTTGETTQPSTEPSAPQSSENGTKTRSSKPPVDVPVGRSVSNDGDYTVIDHLTAQVATYHQQLDFGQMTGATTSQYVLVELRDADASSPVLVLDGTRYEPQDTAEDIDLSLSYWALSNDDGTSSDPVVGYTIPRRNAPTQGYLAHVAATGRHVRYTLSASFLDALAHPATWTLERFELPETVPAGTRFEARIRFRNTGGRPEPCHATIAPDGTTHNDDLHLGAVAPGETVDESITIEHPWPDPEGEQGTGEQTYVLDWGVDSASRTVYVES
jgi:hypothetical protein